MSRASHLPVLLIVVLLALLVAVAVADDKEKNDKPKDVKKMKGKELYKNYCKTCHEPESPNGEYTPMTLIQEQWERFFDEKYVETHKELADSLHGAKPVTEVIDKDMLKKIQKFCIEGAADSEHPMTCG